MKSMYWRLIGISALALLVLFITVPTAFAADFTISDQTSCEDPLIGGIWDGAEFSCTVAAPDYSRPDTSPGVRWVNGIGTPPCADLTPEFCVDEVVRDDSDYIQTVGLGKNGQDIQYFTLSDVPDPNQSTAHFLRYTLKEGNQGTNPVGFTIELRQGATSIATFTHADGTLPQTFTVFQQELTSTQADSITDYNNLELTLTGSCGGSCSNGPSGREKVLVSWIEFEIPGPVTVNSGDSIIISSDVLLKNTGTINNFGTINLDHTIFENTISGIIDNSGTITIVSNSLGDIENAGTINNLSGGTITILSGLFENFAGGIVNNFGTITQVDTLNSGTIDNKAGGIINMDGGAIENFGTFTNSGTTNNLGEIVNSGNIDNFGTLNTHFGYLFNDAGIIDNKAGGIIDLIDGTIDNSSTITNTGTINIDLTSTIDNYGTLDTQTGTIINFGTINNFGTIDNSVDGTAINNLGTLNNDSGGVITGGSPTGNPSENFTDTDGDTISDEVDTLPNTFSFDISDLSLGGTTSGTITKRGGHLLTISEAPNPDGVRITADISGGLTPTTISACGGATIININGGDDVTLTCSSVKLKVHSGQVEITFIDTDGNTGSTILNKNDEVYFKPEKFSLESITGTIEVSLTINDGTTREITLQENDVFTLIVDSTPPVISINGDNPLILQIGDAYVEQGATITDDSEDDLSSSLTIDAKAVDTTTAGTYIVTYDVSDSSGNVALQSIRTVGVVSSIQTLENAIDLMTSVRDNLNSDSNVINAISEAAQLHELFTYEDKTIKKAFQLEFKQFIKDVKAAQNVGQGAAEKAALNELEKAGLKIKMQIEKDEKREETKNKIQTAIQLHNTLEDLKEIRNKISIAKLNHDDEKFVKLQDIEKDLLKNSMILKAESNGKKLTSEEIKLIEEDAITISHWYFLSASIILGII